MFFGHSNPLKVIYPLISSEKLGGERYFILISQKRFL
ncbi:hypothetical protein L933_04075 [Helicobacter pylori PZ5056]|uniref:Uncharacterized protein n=1 Tax=Helicobacter pylori PZ5056 TaxID=1337393 RepID=T2SXX6_HELPX|nr:hypothetical protein L933_04075 [Helicobacter pylori PZ5056]